MSTVLKSSWSSFNEDVAKIYLNGWGHPSAKSKVLMSSLLKERFGSGKFKLADFGCGNGHLASFFRESGLDVEYYGCDFSSSLLAAARVAYEGDRETHFLEVDIENVDLTIADCDVVLFSHVLEMLQSPERSLRAARNNAPLVMVRFFEPPDGDYDVVELRHMNVGGQNDVPYLRRQMSRDYYGFILNKVGCRSVEVHQVDGDKDQVHLLQFG